MIRGSALEKQAKEESKNNKIYAICTIVGALLFKCAIGTGSYSGEATPPQFGDFEAQRHWTEITYQTPIKEWYVETRNNNLTYWGLDYPPLTAYHSWLLGWIAGRLNSSWVELGKSQGLESGAHKFFARSTVLAAELLVYIPAAYLLVYHFQKKKATASEKCGLLWLHLMYPGFLLVDNAHFQYNCISLGLFLWAVICFLSNHDLLGSLFYVCALNYKQIELYHSLPIFFYLLGLCVSHESIFCGGVKLMKLGLVVITGFALIWAPFLTEPSLAIQVLRRIFPLHRGIFEDKVANFWCASSVLIKWRLVVSQETMVKLSSISTLIAAIPTCLLLVWKPSKHQFKLSLICASLAFFIFSYQVHEKSILFVAVPMMIVFHEESFMVSWFLLISVISLYPLCIKDGTTIAFYALGIAYAVWLRDFFGFPLREKTKKRSKVRYNHLCFYGSVTLGLLICVSSLFIPPPPKLPDIFPVLLSVYCCCHFIGFWLYFTYKSILAYNNVSKVKGD